jgi:hypothetical protein
MSSEAEKFLREGLAFWEWTLGQWTGVKQGKLFRKRALMIFYVWDLNLAAFEILAILT